MKEKINEDNEDDLDAKINKIEEKINEKLAEKINDDDIEDDLDEKINKIEAKINEKLEEINDKKDEEKGDNKIEEIKEEDKKETEDKKDEQKKEIIEEKKETNENNAFNKLSSLDSILKGNEQLNILDNIKESEEKPNTITEKENNNMPFQSLYSDKIEDNPDDTNNTNKPLLSLSDMLKPPEEPKKEEKVEDKKEEKVEDKKEEKKEMKKFLTDSYLKPSNKSKGSLEDRKDRMSKRLNMAKKQAKKKEEENKFRKSESITMRASYLENKLNIGVSSDSSKKPIEKIQEENEDNKD